MRNCFINNVEIASETMEKLPQKQLKKLLHIKWRNYLRNNGEITS